MNQPSQTQQDRADAAVRLIRSATLVIFDFDGVIADSEVISLATLQEALQQYGVDITLGETRRLFLGTSLKTIMEYVEKYGTGDPKTFAAAWETTLFDSFKSDLAPVHGVLGLIERLDQMGRRYCIASSSSLNRLAVALGAMGLADRFLHIYSAQQVARGKPAPDLFEHAARDMGVPPESCVVIEDSPHGVHAAVAAGMPCIGFAGGQHLTDLQSEHGVLLKTAGAEMVLSSYGDLARL